MQYPEVKDRELVGTYAGVGFSGGGYVWDDVLEYRVWCHPERGAPDVFEGDDYYYEFDNFPEALEFANANLGTEQPLALIFQKEYISEPEPGKYIHVKEERITEWHVEFLSRPRRTENTIPDFFSPNAPANRMEILRGLA
ncbi:MAG: GCN5 family acetyltransferase [Bacteroidota bacterium]